MKPIVYYLLLAILCISCNQGSKINRGELISELKKLKQASSNNDKDQIAAFISFPLSDTATGMYIVDSLEAEYKQNGNGITKKMFLNHYDYFKAQIEVASLNDVLSSIKLDSLQYKDELEYFSTVSVSDFPTDSASVEFECIQRYEINIEGDTVYIRSSLNGYVNPDKVPDNWDPRCEYGAFWQFRFIENKLVFVNYMAAG